MQSVSVLAKATKADIRTDPYPHVVIENALDPAFYQQLADEFPVHGFLVENELSLVNNKYLKSGTECLESPMVSPAWKTFISYHMSIDYYRDVVDLFGDVLVQYFPEVESRLGRPFADLSIGYRKDTLIVPDMSHPYDVMLDCQLQLDYTFTARPFRGPHVDSPAELYAGLLYMREPEDDSTGGTIAIWRAKDEGVAFPAPRTVKYDSPIRGMKPESLELVYEVPYQANTLVMFINTWRSLHCAQTRSPTVYPRRAINIIGEICRFPEPRLFEVDQPAHLKEQQTKPSLLRRLTSHVLKT